MNGTEPHNVEDTEHTEELDLFCKVLEPLGERNVARLRELAGEYLKHVSPVTWIAEQLPQGGEGPCWELGTASPLDKDATIFALFYDDGIGTAYTFKAVTPEGGGDPVVFYTREFIPHVRYATGPIDLRALFDDLEDHLSVDKD